MEGYGKPLSHILPEVGGEKGFDLLLGFRRRLTINTVRLPDKH